MNSLVVGGLTLTLRGFVDGAGRIVCDVAAYVEDATGGWRPPEGFRTECHRDKTWLVWDQKERDF